MSRRTRFAPMAYRLLVLLAVTAGSTPIARADSPAPPSDPDATAPPETQEPQENDSPPGRPLTAAQRRAIDERLRRKARPIELIEPIEIDDDGVRTLPTDPSARAELLSRMGPEEATKLQLHELQRSGRRMRTGGIVLASVSPLLGFIGTLAVGSALEKPTLGTLVGIGVGTTLGAVVPAIVLICLGESRLEQAKERRLTYGITPLMGADGSRGVFTSASWSW